MTVNVAHNGSAVAEIIGKRYEFSLVRTSQANMGSFMLYSCKYAKKCILSSALVFFYLHKFSPLNRHFHGFYFVFLTLSSVVLTLCTL